MIRNIQKLLRNNDFQGWLLTTAENKDPYFKKIISPNTMGFTLALITPESVDIFVHSLDADNIESVEDSNIHIYNSQESNLKTLITGIINKRGLNQLALNYSTMNDANVDTLGHGTFLYLEEMLDNVSLISSEKIIYGLFDIKTEKELLKMAVAAKRANEILSIAFSKIRVGMSEKEVAQMTQKLIDTKPEYFKEEGVVKEDFSWTKDFCPIVLTGQSFLKGGHAISSDRKIQAGNTVYFDFGVKLTFEDGTTWSSDIQRTGYVLKKGESVAPKRVVDLFNIVRDSITLGIENIKPNMKGYEVDDIVRGYIKTNANSDYDHATGHAIGELAHNPGTILSNRRYGLSDMNIQENGVYTIEPRIPISNGISIEEMVVVKANGKSYTLCERQLELIYIYG